MITFYPRDIGMWRDTFNFNTHRLSKIFYDIDELISFCKKHGVRFDDPNNPFEILNDFTSSAFGDGTFVVKQWTVIGWLKDDSGNSA
jgi:hypothetical protein